MSTARTRPLAFPVGLVALPPRPSATTLWRVVAVVVVLVYAVASGWIALASGTPPFAFDEIHHLLMSRMLAGFPAPDGSGAGYFPAWAVLLTPLWWIWSEPRQIYAAALVVGWIVGLATILPLSALLRRVRLDRPQAITVATLVLLLPAQLVQADTVLSERFIVLLAVFTALAAFRLWERPGHLRAVLFALAVGLLYFSHIRMLTVVLASGIWLLAYLLKRWTVALTGLVSLAVSYVFFDWLGTKLDFLLRRSEMGRGDSFLSHLADVRPGLLVRSLLSQLWTQTIGSYGLFAIGIVVMCVWGWREMRRMRLGRVMWLAGSLVASMAVSTLTWATPGRMLATHPRLDAWMYGRYIDPLTALVCALGLAVVIRGIRTRTWAWSAALSALVVIPTLVFVAPVAPTWGSVTPAHIGGVMPWAFALPEDADAALTTAGRYGFWLWGAATLALFMFLWLVMRRITWLAAVALTVACTVGAIGVHAATEDYRASHSQDWDVVAPLRQLAEEFGPLEVAYDYGCARGGLTTGVGMNKYSYLLLPEMTVTPYMKNEPIPDDADIVLTCPDTEGPEGARELEGFLLYRSVAWIMPGAMQDALDARGVLSPPAG